MTIALYLRILLSICVRKSVIFKEKPDTLNRVPEIAHPPECHLRVVLSGEDTHEGAET